MNTQESLHKSVLVNEVLEYLNVQPGKVYIDVTFGGGGHTRAILEREPTCKVIALDWDLSVVEGYGAAMQEEFGDRLRVLWGNFALLTKIAKKENIGMVDGILADFGTSQIQITTRAGFSLYRDTPLDMRMSPAHQKITAADVVRTASYEKLCEIFWQLADEGRAKAIVQAIIEERKRKAITTTGQLATIVERAVPERRGHRIHPATKVFQALRVYVNKELENIHSFLRAAVRLLQPEGRLVCISFHSLEDRMVKQFFKDQELAGMLKIITNKVVVATPDEQKRNPSSRSACLRAAYKIIQSV